MKRFLWILFIILFLSIMVSSCVILGCSNRADKKNPDLHFYDIPKVIKRQGSETEQLSTKRRALWLERINRDDIPADPIQRHYKVCSVHFTDGKKADLRDEKYPNWAPSLKLTRDTNQSRVKNAGVQVQDATTTGLVNELLPTDIHMDEYIFKPKKLKTISKPVQQQNDPTKYEMNNRDIVAPSVSMYKGLSTSTQENIVCTHSYITCSKMTMPIKCTRPLMMQQELTTHWNQSQLSFDMLPRYSCHDMTMLQNEHSYSTLSNGRISKSGNQYMQNNGNTGRRKISGTRARKAAAVEPENPEEPKVQSNEQPIDHEKKLLNSPLGVGDIQTDGTVTTPSTFASTSSIASYSYGASSSFYPSGIQQSGGDGWQPPQANGSQTHPKQHLPDTVNITDTYSSIPSSKGCQLFHNQFTSQMQSTMQFPNRPLLRHVSYGQPAQGQEDLSQGSLRPMFADSSLGCTTRPLSPLAMLSVSDASGASSSSRAIIRTMNEMLDAHGDRNDRAEHIDNIPPLPEGTRDEYDVITIKPRNEYPSFTIKTNVFVSEVPTFPLTKSPVSDEDLSLSVRNANKTKSDKEPIIVNGNAKKLPQANLPNIENTIDEPNCNTIEDIASLNQGHVNMFKDLIQQEIEDKHNAVETKLMLENGSQALNVYLEKNILTQSVIWDLTKQGLEALAYMDRCGLVHMAIIPENIEVKQIERDNYPQLTITDNVCSTKLPHEPIKIKDLILEYMAPEVCRLFLQDRSIVLPMPDITGKVDVYSFGLMITYMFRRVPILERFVTHISKRHTDVNSDTSKLLLMEKLENDPNVIKDVISDVYDADMQKLVSDMTQRDYGQRFAAQEALNIVESRYKEIERSMKNPRRCKAFSTISGDTTASVYSNRILQPSIQLEEMQILNIEHSTSQVIEKQSHFGVQSSESTTNTTEGNVSVAYALIDYLDNLNVESISPHQVFVDEMKLNTPAPEPEIAQVTLQAGPLSQPVSGLFVTPSESNQVIEVNKISGGNIMDTGRFQVLFHEQHKTPPIQKATHRPSKVTQSNMSTSNTTEGNESVAYALIDYLDNLNIEGISPHQVFVDEMKLNTPAPESEVTFQDEQLSQTMFCLVATPSESDQRVDVNSMSGGIMDNARLRVSFAEQQWTPPLQQATHKPSKVKQELRQKIRTKRSLQNRLCVMESPSTINQKQTVEANNMHGDENYTDYCSKRRRISLAQEQHEREVPIVMPIKHSNQEGNLPNFSLIREIDK